MSFITWLFCALSFAAFDVFKGDDTRTTPPDDLRELLECAERAEPAALGMLYDRFSIRIYNYIYHRVGQADVAEDLTAQVFVKMLEAVNQRRGWQSSFTGWLFRIAHNLVVDHYRHKRRSMVVNIDDATPLAASDGDPVRGSEADYDREQLRLSLGKLTDEQAQVITLRFLEDLSIAEVADVMEKTEGAIKALQYRAVLALRRMMES
jgi:RNA polymerase sigma-70 factor, ECF subfamily